MPTGSVKWFDNKKGYGFIRQQDIAEDIFVHYSSIQGDGFKTLEDGEPVEFELVPGKKGYQADKVVRLRPPAADDAIKAAMPKASRSGTAP